MNAAIRLGIALLLGVGVYFAIASEGPHVDAIGPAALVVAAVLPLVNPVKARDWTTEKRRRSFERRLDASRDHLKVVVKETVHDVLPERVFDSRS